MVTYPKSHLLCGELCLLIIVIITFLSSIRILNTVPNYVNQFENFEDLSSSTITCLQSTISNNNSDNDDLNNISNKENKTIYNENSKLSFSNNDSSLPLCPIDQDRLKYYHDYELNSWLDYSHIQFGGKFRPIGCRSRQKVAIIVPYRDRSSQLEKFSLYIHQFLPDQLIEYSLYIIEQADDKPFNRAKLFNIGVEEINKIHDNNEDRICCYIFHDVDMLPLNQKNLYMCTTQPIHLGPNLSTLRFQLLYPQLFGGVIAMTVEHFNKIGGFSNDFYGWGGEDDDAFNRVIGAALKIDRTPIEFGDYHMMKHAKSRPNPDRYQVLEESKARRGGNSLVAPETTLSYELVRINQEHLYTTISVRV